MKTPLRFFLTLLSLSALPVLAQNTTTPAPAATSASASASGTASKPQVYHSDTGHFSVTTPVAITPSVQTKDSATDKVTSTYFNDKSGNRVYLVSIDEFANHNLEADNPDAFLDQMLINLGRGPQGKVTSSQPVTVDGHPGRVFATAGGADATSAMVHGKIIVVGNHVYQIASIQEKGGYDTAAADAFIASFKFEGLPPASVTAAKSPPVETKSEEGRFSVMAPLILQPSTTETQSTHTFKGNLGFTDYLVIYLDDPGFVMQDANVVLVERSKSAMEKLHGTLLRQQGITLDGHPGLEVVYSATVNNSDVTIKEHSYLVGPRLYVVQFMNIRAKLNEADADTFLNSFKLLPSKP